MKTKIIMMCLCLAIVSAGCAIAPEEPEGKAVLSAEASEAIAVFKEKDPKIQKFFDNSYGWAVLPKVFKGAFLAGGAYGKGEVYEQGKMVGYCSMSQATLGFSFGGEFFREIIFFKTKNDLDVFKTEEFTFSAQVTGVAVTLGAAAKADYKSGMAVFVATDTGLMVDASLGGQKFNYLEKSAAEH
ncbi:MAG: lipid-binding SYLF domain-containing protein [Phycisphaerae bacterium]|nr:lipid-binding SYLF domain-containing protein [Phycisphaerae bacterium]MDD5380855.1 lipid-binding SYLF domain-containing protein [Phycisphaerae bacterium]